MSQLWRCAWHPGTGERRNANPLSKVANANAFPLLHWHSNSSSFHALFFQWCFFVSLIAFSTRWQTSPTKEFDVDMVATPNKKETKRKEAQKKRNEKPLSFGDIIFAGPLLCQYCARLKTSFPVLSADVWDWKQGSCVLAAMESVRKK